MKKIKILFLSDAHSIHTVKWAKFLVSNGYFDIHIFSLTAVEDYVFKDTGIIVHNPYSPSINKNKSGPEKLKYLFALPSLKKVIKQFNPHIIHAHYATSYGLLGALTAFKPFVISAWGSDIYLFPHKSIFHKFILKYNFKKASRIISTSKDMALEIKKYTSKNIDLTPFGVETDFFKPCNCGSLFNDDAVVIGTVKSLEPVYGIEYLIKAFSVLKHKNSEINLKLLIVGQGSLKDDLLKLCEDLHLKNDVTFTGFINHNELVKYYNMLDVFVALSLSESFGVAVLEAASCGKPSVVSNVGGLTEVVENNVTGFIVPPKKVEEAAHAIEKLVLNKELRKKMGAQAREFVQEKYNWYNNAQKIIQIYSSLVPDK